MDPTATVCRTADMHGVLRPRTANAGMINPLFVHPGGFLYISRHIRYYS
jgi:hypothetical protein